MLAEILEQGQHITDCSLSPHLSLRRKVPLLPHFAGEEAEASRGARASATQSSGGATVCRQASGPAAHLAPFPGVPRLPLHTKLSPGEV